MAYSKSYLFLGLNLFVFLSSHVLADIHVPPMLTVEPNLPPMANKLNDKQISELKVYFNFFDKDGDGSINNKELETLIHSYGLNPTDFDLMVSMNKLDGDGNGTIDFSEFLNLMAHKRTDKELKIAFHMCDKDQNGFLSASEIHIFMTNLGQKLTDDEVDEFVREADVDGDGQINYEEFVKVITTKLRDQTKI